MASTALDVARNCEHASQQAQAADAVAKVGAEQSRITIESIKGLTSNLENAVSNLESLEAQAHQIDNVVAVIKNIADQTNLLALNAAIEAARAGEHGRGFAVVADEVRGLSTRTKESTQVISETVSALQKVVRDSVIGVQSACAQARKDVTAVVGLNDHLESISLAVEQVTGMIYQIAAAAEQQAVTADEVSSNILKIDDMTKVILSSAEQVKVATDQLDCGSRQLSGYTAAFKL
ncbi:methyl-accepting chemotaxis protein [Pseudomonas sp. NFACC13-1]|uniref:methyl-accepting chemotaxis protein n=1 Tax=Pseudomonas sp. NFACC13-1 TaxID=1566245 RepID=UPI0035250F57